MIINKIILYFLLIAPSIVCKSVVFVEVVQYEVS